MAQPGLEIKFLTLDSAYCHPAASSVSLIPANGTLSHRNPGVALHFLRRAFLPDPTCHLRNVISCASATPLSSSHHRGSLGQGHLQQSPFLLLLTIPHMAAEESAEALSKTIPLSDLPWSSSLRGGAQLSLLPSCRATLLGPSHYSAQMCIHLVVQQRKLVFQRFVSITS